MNGNGRDMKNGRMVSLREIVTFFRGGTSFKSSEYTPRGTPVLAKGDVKPFGRIEHSGRYADTVAARAANYYFTRPGDLLVTTRDLTTAADFLGLAACVAEDETFLVNQGANVFRVNEAVVDRRYFVYWTCSDTYRQHIKERHTGSTQIHIRADDLLDAPVLLPPLPDQRRIVEVLGALDDKIDLNRRMNNTMEGIARSVFLKQFASETRRAALRNVVTDLRRGVSPTYVAAGGVRVINQKCVRHGWLSFDACRRHDDTNGRAVDRLLLRVGDVVVNSTGVGTLGRVAQVHDLTERTTFDSHVTVVRPDEAVVDELYVGFVLRMSEDDIEELGEGSTGQTELSGARLGSFEIPYAPLEKQRAFAQIAKPLVQRQLLNDRESTTLAELRDTLLPKLFSGELRVREAEDVVADATAGAIV